LPDCGAGILITARQVKKVMTSYAGENKEFTKQYFKGEIDCEFVPQVLWQKSEMNFLLGQFSRKIKSYRSRDSCLLHPDRCR